MKSEPGVVVDQCGDKWIGRRVAEDGKGSVQSALAMQIAGIDIGVDALGEILLKMKLPDGQQLTYCCTQNQGRHLAATILACLAKAWSDRAAVH